MALPENRIVARRAADRGGRPAITEKHRLCAWSECDTVLSRYNLSDHCYTHRPIRFPRVRGAAPSN